MNIKKNLLLFAIIVSLVILPTGCAEKSDKIDISERVLASDESLTFGNFKYMEYTDGTAVITDYLGDTASVKLPDTVNGKTVTELGAGAFAEMTGITSVTLPSGLEKIHDYAFYNCTSLSSVTIGKKLWYIGIAAFEYTPWLAAQTDDFVIVGNNVLLKYQGSDIYVTVPDGIRFISNAFSMNSELKSVTLPDSVLVVGAGAFAYCEALTRVNFGSGLLSVGDAAFEGCEALTRLSLPDGVISIGQSAFAGCYVLTDATLGASLTYIGTHAFDGCTRLKLVDLPATLKTIDDNAFYDCFSLLMVMYNGTAEQFEEIAISSSNYILTGAERYYTAEAQNAS